MAVAWSATRPHVHRRRRLGAVVLLAGLVLVGAGLARAATGVQADDGGAVLDCRPLLGVLYLEGRTSFDHGDQHQACATAVARERTDTLGLLVSGLLLVPVGLVVGSSRHLEDESAGARHR